MEIVLKELFTSSIGLLSLIVIIATIAIGIVMSRWFKRNIEQNR